MILVTGGTGYVGSHTCVALARAGWEFVILDNLSNSSSKVLDRLAVLCGYPPNFILGDITIKEDLESAFDQFPIQNVIHFAGLKSIEDSLSNPIPYFRTNIVGTLNLLEIMSFRGAKNIIFSSSATVYGDAEEQPVVESSPTISNHPYGLSKITIEKILSELQRLDSSWRIANLRYFNPVGAHESGLIGESPKIASSNVMYSLTRAALGQEKVFKIFGGDYPTSDGTGVRDYVHVMDVAEGHVKALSYMNREPSNLCINLGTGYGTSVRELLTTFEKVTSKKITVEITQRREGDVPVSFASVAKAKSLLGWTASRSLETMCRDHWCWVQKNPKGFGVTQ